MHKPGTEILLAGADVSADWIDAARQQPGHPLQQQRFANDEAGHAALGQWLSQPGLPVRIAVEASGIYSLDLTLALHQREGVAVMLVNPRAAKDYRRSRMQRSKTDPVDAAVLCDYANALCALDASRIGYPGASAGGSAHPGPERGTHPRARSSARSPG